MSTAQKNIIALLFLVSGATGLVYETLWIRILSLGVGSTSQSMSVVLSIFFLGLSIGSVLSGRIAKRIERPLYVYGWVELSLAGISLLLVAPLLNLHHLMGMLPFVGSFSWLGSLLKFLIVGVLLLLPTVLMGATLPLLVRIFSGTQASAATSVSRLYGLNTLGAVVGAFITGYWMIPAFGVSGANFVAVAVNAMVGITAIVLGKGITVGTVKEIVVPNGVGISLWRRSPWLLAATLICGFVSIAFEVVWNKYLNIFFGTNLYGIGLVLALFLFGIASGSFALSLIIDRIKDRKRFLVVLYVSTLLALLVSTTLLNEAPRFSIFAFYFTSSFLSLVAVKTLVVTFILFVPTCLFGALFPLVVLALSEDKKEAPEVVGLAYSFNTVGAILGSYLTGMIFLPHLGSSATIRVLLTVMAVTAIVLILRMVEQRTLRISAALATIIVAISGYVYGECDFRNLIKSAYHQKASRLTSMHSKVDWLHTALKPFDPSYEEFKLIHEGETAIITLSHDPADGTDFRNYLRLKTSGLNESVYNMGDLDELPKYEALIGFLPYLFSRAPREAFVVGYGGGYTVDFLTSTDLKRVNVVELEKGILKAANYVYKGNNPITQRASLNLQIEDARFILTTRQLPPQDIIVSQPSHSWLPGASNLFTREFFEIVKANLSDRGIFSQWLNLYNMDVDVLRSILKTFYSVFPEGAVFTQMEDQELVLLGSKQPIELNLQKMELIQKNPIFRKKLAQIFGKGSYDILSLYSVSRADALRLTENAKVNTDRNAYAEVKQSRIFYEGLQGAQTPQQYLSSVFNGDYSHILKGKDSPQFYYNLLVSMSEGSQYDKFYGVLNRYEEKVKGDPASHSNLGYLALKAQRYQSAYRYLNSAFKLKPQVNVLNLLLNSLSEMERYPEVLSLQQKYPALRDKITDCYTLSALNESGRHAEAKRIEKRIASDIAGYTSACGAFVNKILGAHYLKDGRADVAIPFLEAFYSQWGNDTTNLERMILAYQKVSDTRNEKMFREYLPTAIESERKRLQILIDYYQKAGHSDDAEVLSARAARLSQPIERLAE